MVTPVDIKYSYRGTEWHIYEYAKYLRQHGIDAQLLVTENIRNYTPMPKYKTIASTYKMIPKTEVRCKEYVLPFKWHLFKYKNLPKDAPIYFPYSIYDYIYNIFTKPKGQKYIIGCHGMHLKMGKIIDSKLLEGLLNFCIKTVLNVKKDETKDLYFHTLNSEQARDINRVFSPKSDHIFTIPSMIDTSTYKMATNNSDKFKILHIGGPDKGMDVVLDVISILMGKGELNKFEFYFIGECNVSIKQGYNYKNVHFLSTVNEEKKMHLLMSSDAIIIPAYEAFPKTMLEGIASGIYVITSRRNAGWSDVVDHGVKINVVHAGEPLEYIKPLLSLAKQKHNSKKIFDELRRKNRKIAEREFDKSRVLKQVTNMFERVIKDCEMQ